MPELHQPQHPVRLVTASSLFDGHDASINIMRRILQSQGAEVIHLGHNRSVQEVVDAALEEDVQGVAVSSYQGGHVEYFEYLVESLRERGAGHVKVVGGGGGVIVPDEIERLRESGVTIFSPEDGQRLGLAGMINSDRRATATSTCGTSAQADGRRGARRRPARRRPGDHRRRDRRARPTSCSRGSARPRPAARTSRCSASPAPAAPASPRSPTSWSAGFRVDQQDKLRIARHRRRPDPPQRRRRAARRPDPDELPRRRPRLLPLAWPPAAAHELPEHLADVIDRAQGRRLRPRRSSRRPASARATPAIVPFVDTSLYVMTPEFGAASQLEKIDMLDFADVVAINKFERRGAKDALRDVGRQLVRNREAFGKQPEDMPVFGTSRRDVQRRRRHRALPAPARPARRARARRSPRARCPASTCGTPPASAQVVPADRVRYLAEITETVRGYHATTERAAPRRPAGCSALEAVARRARPRRPTPTASAALLERGPQGPARTRSPTSSRAGRRSSSPTPATSRS